MKCRLTPPSLLLALAAMAACGHAQAQAQAQAQSPAANRPGHTESELGMAHHHHHRHHEHEPVAAAPAKPPAEHAPAHAAHPAAGAAKTAAKPPSKPPVAAAPPPAAPPAAAAPATPPEPPKGSVTGLPLPRWAALRTDDVNMRSGPGTRYPIEWVYKRRDLPVQIEREFEVWRLVRDAEGVKGWVHQATLVGHRSFLVVGAEATLRSRPDTTADPVARLKPGVVGRIRACQPASAWCEVQVGEYRGYLPRDAFWGTSPDEAVGG